jgi:hypothetical protein
MLLISSLLLVENSTRGLTGRLAEGKISGMVDKRKKGEGAPAGLSAEDLMEFKPLDLGGKAPMGFVRGGTPTTDSVNLYEQRYREAEARRKAEDEARRVASVPIEQGGAVQTTSQLTAHPEAPRAYIELVYVNRYGAPIIRNSEVVRCKADIIVGEDSANPLELTLIFVCPRCMEQGQKHEQDCQLRMSQRNKWFELKTGMGEPIFYFDDGSGEPERVRSAGMITESEPFTCPDCSWRARIVMNRVRSD